MAETTASVGKPEDAKQDICDGFGVAKWDTCATVVLPQDMRSGLYTASFSLVRLFTSEVQPKKLATTSQPRDIRRGMVCISEECDMPVIFASR